MLQCIAKIYKASSLKMNFLSLLLVVIATGIVAAQNASPPHFTIKPPPSFTIKPITFPPPIKPSKDVCLPDFRLKTATAADTAAANSLTIVPVPRRCERGPIKVIHTVVNEFHWPPIYRKSCDKLFCVNPPCFVRVKKYKCRCVLVYRLIKGCWVKIGYRRRCYFDHLRCGCKKCSDITNHHQCVKTKPCPNERNKKSFCFWKPFPGKCDCCEPRKCPQGRVFNPKICKCDCPPGSKPVGTKCIGVCKAISTTYCPLVTCRDNPHFKCEVKNHKCICPSCKKASYNAPLCTRTVCLEQKSKPKCVFDYRRKRCRCPSCEDQKDKKWCLGTYCGNNNHLQCKWTPYSRKKCICPH